MTYLNSAVILAQMSLNRHADLRGRDALLKTLRAHKTTRYILLWRGKPLTEIAMGHVVFLPPDHPLVALKGRELFLGKSDDITYFAKDISHWTPESLDTDAMGQFLDQTTQHHPLAADGQEFCELRTLMAQLSPLDAELVAAARSMFEWHRSHVFCANCGEKTTSSHAGWQRNCPNCQRPHFPRTDPVVIMLITFGDAVLLGRSLGWPDGMYSLLAGFVEPGETIETAVRREVFEESGIVVGDVTYLTSQPWPYPSSLMIGCHGAAKTKAITIDPVEIQDALWVSKSGLLEIYAETHKTIKRPRKGAIAEFLLSQWLANRS